MRRRLEKLAGSEGGDDAWMRGEFAQDFGSMNLYEPDWLISTPSSSLWCRFCRVQHSRPDAHMWSTFTKLDCMQGGIDRRMLVEVCFSSTLENRGTCPCLNYTRLSGFGRARGKKIVSSV